MFTFDDIKNISKDEFSKLSRENKELVLKILSEYKETGQSQTLKELWEVDYNEIPVSIDEFICNPHYLGKSTRNGESIYPYWRKKYREIFDQHLAYEEIILSGAIGVGKTRTAVVCLAYLLYRLMCLKNPQEYFSFNEGDKITIFFLNINLALAEGVGYTTLHEYLLASDWFLERGTVTGRVNLRYNPPHNITITFGSKSDHALGQQIYCLSGDTKILTTNGIYEISDLCDKEFKTYCLNDSGEIVTSEITTVKETKVTNDYFDIELEDGTTIKCTPEHRLLLKDGSYKCAKDLTLDDELADSKPYGYIYMSKNNVTGKKYIGQHKGQFTNKYFGSGLKLKEAISLFGKKNFSVELICYCFSKQELDEMEKYYISVYDAAKSDDFYNISLGGAAGYSFYYGPFREEHRVKLSKSLKGKKAWNKGLKATEDERVAKHAYRFKGRHHTEEAKMVMSEKHKKENLSPVTLELMRQNKLRMNELKGKQFWINNGIEEHLVNEEEFFNSYSDFNYGRLDDVIYMTKDYDTVRVHLKDVNSYIQMGYTFGKSKTICSNISKSRRLEVWEYNDIKFACSKDLTDYLRLHGYPDIVQSTVTNISRGSIVKKYAELCGRITRRRINEDTKN